ncbi:MAG: RNA polymerase subunit sigma-24 [Flavobacteriales bacterium]|nr:RNA polymerase subunit sigma-24 [Flavobacteriales bacterium]|tara:strand:- start:29060 stop:29647 length:588 start_codon:yes stop_codon:yes gene_type:complete
MYIKDLTDQNLIKQYLSGDEYALNQLVNRHKTKIISFIFSKVRDKSQADDIFQETFFKVIRTLKSGKYNEEGKFLPWVMRIAYNLSMDYFRYNKKSRLVRSNDQFNIFDLIKDGEESKEHKMIQDRILIDLKNIIDKLPVNQQKVLQLRYYSNMSFSEIAENCNISINTALGRMRYALINIRKIIQREGVVLSVD